MSRARQYLLFAASLAAVTASPLGAQDTDREIRREVATWLELVTRRNSDAILARYSRTTTPTSLRESATAEGGPAVLRQYRELFAVSGRARIAPDSVHVVPLGPAAALAWFRFRWVEGREGGGAVTLVYQREGSRWAIVHDQMSLSEKRVPPAETSRPPYDGPRPPATLPDSCVVARVSDGDTIECAPSGRIRLLGVDAPEMDQQANGTAARDALSRMIPPGTSLKLESDVTKRDRYSRVLAYLWLNGEQINWRLVREGWALAYRYEPDVRWAASLERAETLAREEKRGLWAVDGFSCRPEDRRRRAC